MLLPISSHSNKLIYGRPTDARRPELYTEEGNVQKKGNKTNQQATGEKATCNAFKVEMAAGCISRHSSTTAPPD